MLLTPNDPQWLAAWSNAPGRDVFAHPAYVALFEDEKTRACAFFRESEKGSVLYPFLLRNLHDEPFWMPGLGEGFDMVTPYGYGGPLLIEGEPTPELYRQFYEELQQWALQNKVVTEFVRFSLFNDARLAYYGQVQHNNDNIVVDLSLSSEALWKGFRHKVRKNVQTARAAGISIAEDPAGERLSEFIDVYYHTLERRKAAGHYFKPISFFKKIIATLPRKFMFFHALSGEKVVASELVLLSDRRIYSFLGGTYSHSFHLRPGDLLKYHIMQWAREQGYQQFVIGGGHQPHDGIFAFKQAFAPTGIYPFYVGKKVFNQMVYEQLVQQSANKGSGFFPEYRG